MNFRNSFRQFLYPKELRIMEPAWSEKEVAILEKIAELIKEDISATAEKPAEISAPSKTGFLSDLATGLWRLRLKMIDQNTARPLEEMRRAYRHFESVWDLLEQAGVKIYEHTGEDFNSGRALRVLAFQPTDGLKREKVIETIKPTIYVHDELVQTAEVIVGTPGCEKQ